MLQVKEHSFRSPVLAGGQRPDKLKKDPLEYFPKGDPGEWLEMPQFKQMEWVLEIGRHRCPIMGQPQAGEELVVLPLQAEEDILAGSRRDESGPPDRDIPTQEQCGCGARQIETPPAPEDIPVLPSRADTESLIVPIADTTLEGSGIPHRDIDGHVQRVRTNFPGLDSDPPVEVQPPQVGFSVSYLAGLIGLATLY